jgi:GLPGLI family protein
VPPNRIIDNCIYSAIYQFKHLQDTIKKQQYYDKQVLEIGDSISHYYSILGYVLDSLWYKFNISNKQTRPNKDGSDVGFNPVKALGLKDDESIKYEDFYINYPKKGVLEVMTNISFIDFIYEEPVPKFEWKLQADTATILGYKCLKATTTFRGRNYEVWFTPFIPIRQGPWKFNGLPGLILKATDTNGYFEWTATSIEKPKNKKIYAYLFDKIRMHRVTRKELINLLHKRWKDPFGLIFLINSNQQTIGYKDAKTGKLVLVNRGDVHNYQRPYIPIPELE